METTPDISVIVPFLNEERYIRRCIEALIDQDLDADRYELLFVDNGSTDRSCEIASSYSQVALIREETPQVYVARNTATRHARARYLAFTDADCKVSPDWLSSILRAFEVDRSGIVMGKRYFAEGSSRMAHYMEDYENAKIESLLERRDYKRLFGYTNNMAVSRVVYDRLNGFRVVPLADTDLVRRYVAIDEDPIIRYAPGASIEHLEISTWRDWARKLLSYGWNSPKSDIDLHISLRERHKLYLHCLRGSQYGPMQKLLLLITAIGANFMFAVPFVLAGGRIRLGG